MKNKPHRCTARIVPAPEAGARLDGPRADDFVKEYQFVFDAAPNGILRVGEGRMILGANPRFLQIFGYQCADQLIGSSTRILFPTQQAFADVVDSLYPALADGGVGTAELTMVRHDGSRFWCHVNGRYIDPAHPATGSIWIYEDVTRQRQLLETTHNALAQLRATQAELIQAEKMAALGGLVAGVAHEINTPIGIGLTAASYLDDRAREFERSYCEGRIKRSEIEGFVRAAREACTSLVTNLRRAADQVRSFKQVAVDQSSEVRRHFNLKSYLDEILLSLRPKLKRTRHTVTVHCAADIELDSYPGAYSQIITNLLTNALLHAFGQDQAGRIDIGIEAVGTDRIELRFSDDGKGMAPDIVARIYEPFFTTRRGQGGSGLGLHLVFNLVTQLLGGSIECHSVPQRGTRFVLSLPRHVPGVGTGTVAPPADAARTEIDAAADDAPINFDEEIAELSTTTENGPPPWEILIVDDEQEVHDVTRLALTDFRFLGRGLRFRSAYSAHEAMRILDGAQDIAVVLLDVVMESEDAGLKVVEHVRRQLHNGLMRIVLRTGQPGQVPEKRVIVDYDINDYKTKTELTAERLYATMVAALRTYNDICTIELNRRGLRTILDTTQALFQPCPESEFSSLALSLNASLLQLEHQTPKRSLQGFVSRHDTSRGFIITHGTGKYAIRIDQDPLGLLSSDARNKYLNAFHRRTCHFDEQCCIVPIDTPNGIRAILFFESPLHTSETVRNLMEVFRTTLAMAMDNVHLNHEIESAQREIVVTIGSIAEFRSNETGNHVRRVAEYSKVLATACGLSETEAELLRNASPFHDIGKIGIPDAILNKPGKLLPEEWAHMQRHAEIGYEMLSASHSPVLQMGAIIALTHHEKWDGSGYPQGLAGTGIPIYGRITALADVFDALSCERCYKACWPVERVCGFIEDAKGGHFDPTLVELFQEHLGTLLEIRKRYSD